MQPSYSSIGQIFSAQTRYVVPLFQRPYVWTKEEQWRPLYEDIEQLADRVLNPPTHKPVAGHFLGTAVLEQVAVPSIATPQRRIIDGQQRLTTLQIVLKAAVEAIGGLCESSDASIGQARGRLELLCFNQFAPADEDRFKVWPTNDDRAQYRGVMDHDQGSEAPAGRMGEAFDFFRTSFTTWLDQGDRAQRALALASGLTEHLRMIVLDLDHYDEPQAIFETLNAHGTPLLPADLIKNWLLWEAGKAELDATDLYSQFWAPFDSEHVYWRKIVGTGHAARPRVDTFLQNWLTLETAEAVSVKHLYDRFLAYANGLAKAQPSGQLDLPALMKAIAADADRYRRIDEASGGAAIDTRLSRLNRLDYVVFRPVLIGILRHSDAHPDEVQPAIAAIESFLVRRMVCGEQTRGYGNLAVSLVQAMNSPPDGLSPIQAMIESLQTAGWPDDDRFRHQWLRTRFYKWFRVARVLTILQAIEQEMQRAAVKSEKLLVDVNALTIEHIMPQAWQANWPLGDGDTALDRDARVQNIGNLTLVTDRLNPALSNAPWSGAPNPKGEQLAAHSKLEMNKLLLAQAGDQWTDAMIAERADKLFEFARTIWPSASVLKHQFTD
jgi:hypothetical protein